MHSNYHKFLEVSCDDEVFSSGKIIVGWTSEDQDRTQNLRVATIQLDLQRGDKAVLTVDEVENLIQVLQTVKNRLS